MYQGTTKCLIVLGRMCFVRNVSECLQAAFLSALNLVPNTTAGRVKNYTEAEIPALTLQKLAARRGQVSQFFRTQPLPVSSTLGRKIIRAGFGQCSNPADEVARYDKYCAPNKRNQIGTGNPGDWPVVNVKKAKLKPGQHCHKYSFGSRQRRTRQVELAVGKCNDILRCHNNNELSVDESEFLCCRCECQEFSSVKQMQGLHYSSAQND